MNLVKDAWLPCRYIDGQVVELTIARALSDPGVVDLALPRADFQGAAYQLLIGLLQTLLAPADKYEWHRLYKNPPDTESLQQVLNHVAHAFNLVGEGPLFMQDLDPLLDAKSITVSGLLIDAPGENGIKNNTDHFVKRAADFQMSLPMAALALLTLQINAPSGGQGHRVGLRGGGPLTTLLIPQDENSTLWQKIWLNIINKEVWPYDQPDYKSTKLFPWLGKTKLSNKPGTELYANEVHPLAMYWAMPRRIRLEVEEKSGQCRITGVTAQKIVSHYRTQNYGNNYSGQWFHPLAAYRWDTKKPEEVPNSVKAQPGGLTYKYWDILNFSLDESGQKCATVVTHFYAVVDGKENYFGELPRLWVFGYDMDNMKARGWYSRTMPLFSVDFEQQADFLRTVRDLQSIVDNIRKRITSNIKDAWFERPKEAKGDTSFVQAEFWQRTEALFFQAVQKLSQQENHLLLNTDTATEWLKGMRATAINLFDEYTLSVDIGDTRSMKRCMQARSFLTGWLYGGKEIKNFIQQHDISANKEVA